MSEWWSCKQTNNFGMIVSFGGCAGIEGTDLALPFHCLQNHKFSFACVYLLYIYSANIIVILITLHNYIMVMKLYSTNVITLC